MKDLLILFMRVIVATGVVLANLVNGSALLMPLGVWILVWNLPEEIIYYVQKVPVAGESVPRWMALSVTVVLVAVALTFIFSILNYSCYD